MISYYKSANQGEQEDAAEGDDGWTRVGQDERHQW